MQFTHLENTRLLQGRRDLVLVRSMGNAQCRAQRTKASEPRTCAARMPVCQRGHPRKRRCNCSVICRPRRSAALLDVNANTCGQGPLYTLTGQLIAYQSIWQQDCKKSAPMCAGHLNRPKCRDVQAPAVVRTAGQRFTLYRDEKSSDSTLRQSTRLRPRRSTPARTDRSWRKLHAKGQLGCYP